MLRKLIRIIGGGGAPPPGRRAPGPGRAGDDVDAAATGASGESQAAEFLQARGYAVIVRNWRNPRDRREELDLVCRDGETLVFVEVKARGAGALVPGYYAVDRRKKKVLLRACSAYLRSLRVRPACFRLDIVEVSTSAGSPPAMLHFENIPLFDKHWRP
jgi:putative endonuclease